MKPSWISGLQHSRTIVQRPPDSTSLTARVDLRTYLAVLLASPAIIFFLNRNWPFQGFGDYDAFFYFGHFIHFPHYQRLQPTYAGERLPWVLPGYALVHLFDPLYGTLVLHFLAYYASIFSLFSIVTRFSGSQAGFFVACALCVHPYFLAANGMDYVTAGCITYCLVTFAFLVRSAFATAWGRWVYLFAAGLTWAAAVYTNLVWVVFTPACLAVYLAAEESNGGFPRGLRGRLMRIIFSAGAFGAGGLALTLTLVTVHYLIYGVGGLAFQAISIGIMRDASGMRDNPYASKSFSVTYADWLVFPGVAAGLSVLMLIPKLRRRFGLRPGTDKLVWMYLYFATVMVVMTVRMNRILEFDYFASFLLPGAFIVFGVTIFYLPIQMSKPWSWLVVAIACFISLAPLARPGLYVKPPILGAIVPGLFLTGALAIRLLRPTSLGAMTVMALGLSAASFCLAPAVGGIAWRGPGDWMSATRRVGAAVKTIENRLPPDKYPAFWYKEDAPRGLEFQAIMCAFLSHGVSMRNLPEIAPGQRYPRGQILVLLSDRPASFESAASTMERYGMPLSFLWEQRIESAGVAFWVTATEIRQTKI